VRRPATLLPPAAQETALAAALAAADRRLAGATLKLDAPLADLPAEPGLAAPVVVIEKLEGRTGRFEARLTTTATQRRVTGSAEALVGVPVLTRAVARGEALGSDDWHEERRPARLVASMTPASGRLAGLVARRPLATGEVLREADLVRPDLVERNQLVAITYEAPGLSLSLKGKALAAGPEGAVVQVLNLSSKRQIDAVITGPGRVSARLTTDKKDK
jgi:flagella basal body P-ring formation protein FlgA